MIPPKAIKKVKNEVHLEIAAGSLVAYGVFPQTSEGIQKAKETAASKDTWLAPSDLPEYYDGIDNDLIIGNETDGIRAIREHLKEFYGISSIPAAGVEVAVDTRVSKPTSPSQPEKKEVVVKAPVTKKVNHPKLPPHLQRVHSRYMWGQHGVYDLEFESDIDKAIYHSLVSTKTDKEGYYSKETPQKTIDFREWLFQVTGLSATDIKDHAELKSYKKKILETIKEIIVFEEGFVEVPPVYDGYYQDPDDEEEDEEDDEEEMDDEEYDDLYGSNLDDLLNSLKEDEGEDPEEIADQIEEKKQELEDAVEEEPIEEDDEDDIGSEDDIPDELLRDDEGDIGSEDDIPDELLQDDEEDMGSEDDIPDELLQDDIDPSTLEEILNRRKKTKTKEKKSYYVSNTKLLQGITKSLAAVTGQLEQVNQSLLEQNDLIRANIEISTASLEALRAQDDILTTKFDAILNAFQKQYEQTEKAKEDAERLRSEQKLEAKTDAAGAETPEDLTKGGKKGGRINRIHQYYKNKLVRQLYRKLPKRVRQLRVKGRKLQRVPGRIKSSAANRITRMLPKGAANFTNNLRAARSAAGGMKGIAAFKSAGKNIPGLKQALSVWEYGDRKASGQSETQAMAGVGGGLAGAAAGAAIGTMLFPGVGTLAGLLIGAAFSAAGGYAGAKIADTMTGVDKNDQHERGTDYAEPGTAMLHGTEMLIHKDKMDQLNPFNSIGATLVSATSKFINSLGPAGAQIAPLFEQKAAPLVKVFGLPATTAQTNVGGGFSYIGGVFNKVEKKKEKKEKESYGKEFDDLMKGNSESFAEKLLKMLDPKNIFANILSFINRDDAPEFDGDSLMAEGGEAVTSGDLTDTYGTRGGRHKGIDIASGKFRRGTPISVIKPGTVVFAGWQDPNNKSAGWGQFVAIKHDDGTASLYGHLDQINVTKGQRVEPDSTGKFPVIGKLGNTGSSTGPHLHFEVGTGWTGGTLSGHMNPAPVAGQYFRGGGNVKKKETTGDAPTVKPGAALSGQEVTQNFGMQTGQERVFTSGGKQFKAHKTATGFEFFNGMTRIDTSKDDKGNIANANIVKDFIAQQSQAMYAPPKPESIEMINQFETDEQAQYIVINQQKQPQLPQAYGNMQFQNVDGQWRSTKEYDVKVIEKLRLSLQ